ncbi:hypothetical protein GGR56DRAFT_652503 [Xylariaceae sp. FL0804]|nr:hypothetical protein GGR56DRAFT_652503 [Xylariaceae sp. FL0804]
MLDCLSLLCGLATIPTTCTGNSPPNVNEVLGNYIQQLQQTRPRYWQPARERRQRLGVGWRREVVVCCWGVMLAGDEHLITWVRVFQALTDDRRHARQAEDTTQILTYIP